MRFCIHAVQVGLLVVLLDYIMPGLSQGLLANNSVSPDVEIKEYKDDPARTRLKLAVDKKVPTSNDSQFSKVSAQSSAKVMQTAHPIVIEKQHHHHSKPIESINDNFLAYEVAKLSNKLESFEKTAKLQEKGESEQRTLELEKKLTEITDKRLQHLEKLQHEQEQWKSQYFQTIQKLNEPNPSRAYPQQMTTYPIAPTTSISNPELQKPLLQTPLPRKDIPQPTSSVKMSNGQFLRDILDQYNASTPNVSHNAHLGPIDVIPSKLSHQDIAKGNSLNIHPERVPSPINVSSNQAIAKEIENDVQRQKISEKFPSSFSDYLPHSKSSPVSRLCTKAVPPSSLVAEFRLKLRQLAEMRTTLENNLQAVQRKPRLEDFALATLADQLEKSDWSNVNDEKIEMYWIQKLVDEQIALSSANFQQKVPSQLKMQSKPLAKDNAGKSLKQMNKRNKESAVNKSKFMKKKSKTVETMPESDNDEDALTHVYGKAEYHPHRSTVHQPFMHVSPIKSPRFRNKRALQSVPVTHVRSEKSQTTSTHHSPTILRSKYLAPTALSLRPPQIYENDPDPIVISAAAPMTVVSKPSPKKKSPVKPSLPEVEIANVPDELPGNTTSFETTVDDIPPSVAEKVQLKGEGIRSKPISKDTFPPAPPKPSPRKCNLDPNDMRQISGEDKVKCWVEQEIMARILGELHPMSANQETQTLNIQTDSIRRIIEDEIQNQIHQKLMKRKPKENQQREPDVIVVEVKTPLSTPQRTPPPSVSEQFSFRHDYAKTPSLTPQSSIIETEPSISEVTPHPPRVATPAVEEVEVTIVATPLATPVPSSPEISCKEISVSESVEESVASVVSSLPDPWEGKNPEEHTNLRPLQEFKKLQTAPEPDPTELVVREVTPPPVPRKILYSSTSESSSSEDSFKTEDKTISEGQLLIEHGEMIPKKRQPFQIPDNLDEYIKENTLADAADFDPISEGEFRPSMRPIVPKRSANYVNDDPTGVYSRPRKPLNTSSDREDVSVGEIPGKREKFQKWKSARQSSKVNSASHPKRMPDPPSSDLNSTSIDSSSLSEEIAPPPNVIMVTSATPRVVKSSENNQNDLDLDGSQQDVLIKDSLDDPLPRPRNQMTLTLPSYDALSGASDTEEISVQDL